MHITRVLTRHARWSLFTAVLTLSPALFADDLVKPQTDDQPLGQIVVTGSQLDTQLENSGSSISIISEQDLKDGQYRDAVDALRQVPGVDAVQSGGSGGNAAIFMRGANSEHTLVMLDGIELNNPATVNRSFNMANLTLENIERIEVIRGPQSTVYGSDAMGGVINLISKKAKQGAHARLSSEAGSYNSFTQVGDISYGSKKFDISTGITRQDVGSISAASASDGNKEQDDYQNTSISNRMRFAPTDEIEATSTTRYVQSHANLDNAGGINGDDPNRWISSREFFTRGDVSAKLLDRTLTPSAYLSYTRHSLGDRDLPNQASKGEPTSESSFDSDYNGDIVTVGSRAKWEPTNYFSSVLGGESQGERADSFYRSQSPSFSYEDVLLGQEARTNSAYLESRFSYNQRAYLDTGIRYDHHSIFGSRSTFKVAPAIHVSKLTKVRGSFGTGFKAPSLVQLYSSYGNRELEAETNIGWDVGVDQDIFADRLSSSLTFFRADYDNLVTFNPATFILENINESRAQGVEVGTTLKASEELSLRVAYTYTDTENNETGESLLRRPRNKAAVTAVYSPTSALRAQLQWRAYSSRFDNDFSSYPVSRTALSGYGLVDLALSYKLRESVELFGRVDNIFDQEYQEVYGFGTFGAAAYGGIKVEFE